MRHIEEEKKRAREWGEKNPEKKKISNRKGFQKFYNEKRERFNELMLESYYRNPEKNRSR